MMMRHTKLLITEAFIGTLVLVNVVSSTVMEATTSYHAHDGFSTSGSLLLIDRELDLMGNDKLLRYLTRVGPNMRASTDYHDFKDIQIDEALLAWKLMHKQAQDFSQDQVRFYKPKITSLLLAANVSQSCLESVEFTLDSIKRLDSWAVQMYNSMGSFPPVGLLSGQLTDSGSYLGCINLVRPVYNGNSSSDSSWRMSSGHTSYCTIALRPIVPKRPEFHMVFNKLDKRLIEQFGESDVFHTLAQNSQFFHYLYMKTGVCVPSECSPEDIQRVVGLVSRRLVLAQGPVRCFTRDPRRSISQVGFDSRGESKPTLVKIDEALNNEQLVAVILVLGFFGLILMATLIHFACISVEYFKSPKNQDFTDRDEKNIDRPMLENFVFENLSFITNAREFFNTTMKSNEIKCLHGLRVITMFWIIFVHTFQYNNWSGFTQVFEIIPVLQNIVLQPLFNANYTIDSFFFMSGLLSFYTAYYSNKGSSVNFSFTASLVGRYLRLTPQVMLISLFYILLPIMSHGPAWFEVTHDESRYCEKNWWINLLHLQSFYRVDEICNLVSWWISVDMFYYVLAVGFIFLMLKNQLRKTLILTSIVLGLSTTLAGYQHYMGGFEPNNLGVVPQIDEVWTNFILHFVWTPQTHAFPFFYGLWIGYVLANNMWHNEIKKHSTKGWILSSLCLIFITLSSYVWTAGYMDISRQYISTLYNITCPILWCISLSWIIMASHYGCLPTFNKVMSNKLFVWISKASFIIYLSHMVILRTYFGLQSSLVTVSIFSISYIVIGNILFSTIFGIFLSISFEGPFMKLQKAIVRKLKYSPQTANIQIHSPKEVNSMKTLTKSEITIDGSKVNPKMCPTEKCIFK